MAGDEAVGPGDGASVLSSPTAYADELLFDWERRNLFDTSWVCVARSEELKSTGDQFAEAVGETPVLYLRGEDGALRGFLDTCRHMGTRLLPCGEAVNCEVVTCRGHAWTYALDGRLLATPAHESGGIEIDKAANSLLPVATREWLGMVFSNVDAGRLGHDFEQHVGDLDDFATASGLGDAVVAGWREYVVAANWKLVLAHAPLVDQASVSADTNSSRAGGGAWRFDAGDEVCAAVFPNFLFRASGDHCVTWLLMPQGVAETVVLCDWVFLRQCFDEEGFDPTAMVEAGDLANQAAFELAEVVQQRLEAGSPARLPVGLLGDEALAEIVGRRYDEAAACEETVQSNQLVFTEDSEDESSEVEPEGAAP